MKPLSTRVNRRSAEFAENHSANLEACEKLENWLERSRQGGGEKANARHLSRGKLLPGSASSFFLIRGAISWKSLPLPEWA